MSSIRSLLLIAFARWVTAAPPSPPLSSSSTTTSATDHGFKIEPLPVVHANITEIAADAAQVLGATFDEMLAAYFDVGQETIMTSRSVRRNRKRADAPAQPLQRQTHATPWGTTRHVNPNNEVDTTISIGYNGGNFWPDDSIRFNIITKHSCRDHHLPNWLQMDGATRRDSTVQEAFDEIPHIIPRSLNLDILQHLLDELQELTQTSTNEIAQFQPPGVDVDAKNDWVMVAGTFAHTPGYSYAISQSNAPVIEPGAPDDLDEKAVALAALVVARKILWLTTHELQTNRHVPNNFDVYVVKVLLYCLEDMIEDSRQILLLHDDGDRVTREAWDVAMGQLARGEVAGDETASRFLSVENFHDELLQPMDCSSDSD